MKRIVVILATLSALACTKKEISQPINNNPASMSEMIVSDNFNYGTSAQMDGVIEVKDLEDSPMAGIRISIYDAMPEFGGQLLNAGMTNANGIFAPFGVLPGHLTSVVVVCHAVGFPNVLEVATNAGAVSASFGGSEFKAVNKTNKTEGVTAITPAGGNCYYMASYNSQGVPSNFLTPNDVIDPSFLNMVNNSLPEQAPVPLANPGYLATGNSTDIKITQNADIWITFVHEGAGYKNTLGYFVYNTSNPPATKADIDSIYLALPNASFAGSGGGLYSGNKIHLGTFGPNTSIGWVLFQNAWTGSGVNTTKQRFYSNPDFNPETTASLRQHNVQLFDNSRDVVLIGFEDLHRQSGSDEDFNDLIFYVSANPISSLVTINIPRTTETATDSDGDGVIDNADDYPNDASKAFNNWANGTLAFEDMWPLQGDYDFNDLVTGYAINQITNGSGNVVQIDMDLEVRAVGAGFTNSLGFMLGNLVPSDIQSITGQYLTGSSVASNGTENNQAKAVVVAIDDVYSFLGRPAGAFFNTLTAKPSEAFKSTSITIALTSPKSPNSVGLAPFNAFIVPEGIDGSQLRREVHLPGQVATALVNAQLFGQYDDNTNPSQNIYYKTNTNLPWAMNISSSEYKQVVEFTPIINAYYHFANWAQTSGGSFNDWYLNKNGYRNTANVFE